MKNKVIPDDLSNKLRASYYFMASLLAKYKHVKMHFPGGCQIGSRPIDQTLKVFKALGAEIKEKDCVFDISARKLVGNEITLDMPSVGATVNGIIVAALAEGETVIHNAAREPEIVDLADMLNKMGAKITGAGNSTVKIVGVEELDGCFHNVIPDRIEAGTYIILGALVGTYLRIENIIPEHIKTLLDKMQDMGCDLEINQDSVVVNANDNLLAIDIKTSGYPGFPTDLQQPFTVLLTQASGKSKVTETIWENRFMHIPYLKKLGADIEIKNQTATIVGPSELKGEEVVATDLRAGAAMVAAALTATGKTTITNAEHILRGYEQIVEKLSSVGAKIRIKEI
jgi:UDP-N-acetylglucosamine 1-carboxyvinyltransferase